MGAVYTEPSSAAYTELRDICMEGGRMRGVDYSGRAPYSFVAKGGFELVHGHAYHPHYLTGKHKGFWNRTPHAVGQRMVREGSLSAARLEQLVAGMSEADASPITLVAYRRMHQIIARKPGEGLTSISSNSRKGITDPRRIANCRKNWKSR